MFSSFLFKSHASSSTWPSVHPPNNSRTWVDPPDGTYNLAYTTAQAQRFAAKGLTVYLDYHFSDTWADPQHQIIPDAWSNTSLDSLSTSLRFYVNSSLQSLAAAGVAPQIVSLGNEIRRGTLWPIGQVDPTIADDDARTANFTNLATLYKSARIGVDDAIAAGVPKPDIMIHIDNGWDLELQKAWFSGLTGSGIVSDNDWDVFGFSFYPFYGTNATFANLNNTLTTIAKQYGKPVQVVETDFPAVCEGVELSEPVEASPSGQNEWVKDVIDIVRGVPDGLGKGVHYWEPTWLNNTGLGSACNDAILFQGDYSNPAQTVGYSRESVAMFLE